MKNMFLPQIALFAALVDSATASGVPVEAVAPAKKKQHTITVREADKTFLNDLQAEFYGPQASNPEEKRFLSTEEGFAVVLEVATDHRFTYEPGIDEAGEPSFDEDGNPVMVLVDRFAVVAAKLIEARGIKAKSAKVSTLQAQLEALKAELAAVRAAKGETVEA
jgi:hypothetical protein